MFYQRTFVNEYTNFHRGHRVEMIELKKKTKKTTNIIRKEIGPHTPWKGQNCQTSERWGVVVRYKRSDSQGLYVNSWSLSSSDRRCLCKPLTTIAFRQNRQLSRVLSRVLIAAPHVAHALTTIACFISLSNLWKNFARKTKVSLENTIVHTVVLEDWRIVERLLFGNTARDKRLVIVWTKKSRHFIENNTSGVDYQYLHGVSLLLGWLY